MNFVASLEQLYKNFVILYFFIQFIHMPSEHELILETTAIQFFLFISFLASKGLILVHCI